MPDFKKHDAPVKLNAAAVMREAQAIKKQQEEEQKIIKEIEMNHRDATEFNRWKSEMDEKDEVERLEHIQKKKIEMELAREEAIIAQQKLY